MRILENGGLIQSKKEGVLGVFFLGSKSCYSSRAPFPLETVGVSQNTPKTHPFGEWVFIITNPSANVYELAEARGAARARLVVFGKDPTA